MQALLETEKQSSTFDPTMKRELVRLRPSHDKLKKVASDLGYARPCPIAWAIFDLLISFSVYFVSTHELGS